MVSSFLKKLFGPFDYKSFSKFNYFILFWAGEKAKAAGFLFSLINSKINLIKKHFSLALKIIISAIVLAYLFSIIPFSSILSSILSADIFLLLVGIIISSPISYLSAFETQYLTKIQGMTLSVFEILKIHLATSFYGLFLPGTLSGGAVKWYKFSKHSNKSSAAAVIVLNRFLEVLMIIIMGILFSLPILYEAKNQKLLILLVIIFSIMILLYFALLKKSVLILIGKIFHKLPFPYSIKEKIEKFLKAMGQFQNLRLKDHLEIFGLLFLYHGLGLVSFYFFAHSLNINVSIWVIGWVRSATAIAIMLPFSFAGLGIREGTLVFLLGQYGVMPNDSIALSFIFFFRNILSSLFGGLFEFKNFTFSNKKKETESTERTGDK